MLNNPRTIPVRTRLRFAAWAVAAVVALFSVMSSLLQAAAVRPTTPCRAAEQRILPENGAIRRKSDGRQWSDTSPRLGPKRPIELPPRLVCRIFASAPLGLARALRLYPPPMNLITRKDELAEACARLASAPFVAVDTEFMREQTFWPRLCLIQMAGRRHRGADRLPRARARPHALLRADGRTSAC